MPDVGSVLKSFQPRNQLNPLIWSDDGVINPKVRKILLKAAEHFINSWDLERDIDIKDIRFTGSLAAFNWSKFSDIDLHIVVDFDEVNDDEQLVSRFFTLMKSNWNDKHRVMIGPYEIEVYVENEGEDHKATGLYSVMKGEWIKEPTKEDQSFDPADVHSKANYFLNMYDILIRKYNNKKYESVLNKIESLKEKIRKMRSAGLQGDGQFSTENLAFKVLRRTGFLKKINDLKNRATDKHLTEKRKNSNGR